MRQSRFIPTIIMAFLIGTMAIFTSGCLKDQCDRTQTFIQWEPVYRGIDEMRKDIKASQGRALENPGQIWYYNGYLLINKPNEGIHIIDNKDPENPVNQSFLEIDGNFDMAVKNGVLYADQFMDLLALDISDIDNIKTIGRTEDVFLSWYPFLDNLGFVVDYVRTPKTLQIDCSDNRFGVSWFRGNIEDILFISVDAAFDNSVSNNSSGEISIGGSMARFTTAKGHLYTLENNELKVFSLSQPIAEYVNTVGLEWGVETLFPYKDNLFIGANNGMFIYDNSDPSAPSFLSQFVHARSCDPVFISDNVAYVTLRSGNACRGFINQLDVIDISKLTNPKLIRSYPMENPHGLSVVENTLFLCEGEFGLKVFDVSDPLKIANNRLSTVTNLYGFDVIVLPPGDLVMVIGQDGLYQYDASDPEDLKELSTISISR